MIKCDIRKACRNLINNLLGHRFEIISITKDTFLRKIKKKNHQVITYEYKNMEDIERKINISDNLDFNFFQIWRASYYEKSKRELKKLSKSNARHE